MPILRRYVEKKIWINFHVISTYFFDVISMGEKSTSFRRTLFDVISMSEKLTSFRRILFGVTSMSEISTSFRCFFFFRLDFDGRKINIVSVYFGVQFKWKTDVTAHILMLF